MLLSSVRLFQPFRGRWQFSRRGLRSPAHLYDEPGQPGSRFSPHPSRRVMLPVLGIDGEKRFPDRKFAYRRPHFHQPEPSDSVTPPKAAAWGTPLPVPVPSRPEVRQGELLRYRASSERRKPGATTLGPAARNKENCRRLFDSETDQPCGYPTAAYTPLLCSGGGHFQESIPQRYCG